MGIRAKEHRASGIRIVAKEKGLVRDPSCDKLKRLLDITSTLYLSIHERHRRGSLVRRRTSSGEDSVYVRRVRDETLELSRTLAGGVCQNRI